MTALVVTGEQKPDIRERGAVGLYVPGRGLYVSREEALAALGPLPQALCAPLQPCRYELFVSVPPLGPQPNRRRYDVTLIGGAYRRGLLVSDSTRIPGLVSVDDIRETVSDLDHGRDPPIRFVAHDHPVAAIATLDRRLTNARDAQLPATVALGIVLISLAAASLVTRRAIVARAALLYPLVAILLALLVAAVDRVGSLTTAAVVAAAPLAFAVARLGRLRVVVPILVAAYGVALARWPETNALMAIGPNPWTGGRFYGVTNLVETVLLAPLLAAATAMRGWRIAALGLLGLVVVGASQTGADGGGILVFATAFVALWVLRAGRRFTWWSAGAVVAVALAAVALDALAGGSSHVVDAVTAGPATLFDHFTDRLDRSFSIVTSTIGQLAGFAVSIVALVVLATRRPRFATVDAFLIALAVSLLVNDSPTKVAGFGAMLCGALRAWSVSRSRGLGIHSTP